MRHRTSGATGPPPLPGRLPSVTACCLGGPSHHEPTDRFDHRQFIGESILLGHEGAVPAVSDPQILWLPWLAVLRLPFGEALPDRVHTCKSEHDSGEDSAPTADECSNGDKEKDCT